LVGRTTRWPRSGRCGSPLWPDVRPCRYHGRCDQWPTASRRSRLAAIRQGLADDPRGPWQPDAHTTGPPVSVSRLAAIRQGDGPVPAPAARRSPVSRSRAEVAAWPRRQHLSDAAAGRDPAGAGSFRPHVPPFVRAAFTGVVATTPVNAARTNGGTWGLAHSAPTSRRSPVPRSRALWPVASSSRRRHVCVAAWPRSGRCPRRDQCDIAATLPDAGSSYPKKLATKNRAGNSAASRVSLQLEPNSEIFSI